jgi:hypothetical protein
MKYTGWCQNDFNVQGCLRHDGGGVRGALGHVNVRVYVFVVRETRQTK